MAAVETKKDEVVDRFETYEDYLDTFITEDDMIFLGEEEIARIVVELGYRSSATLTRQKFFQTKAELAAARNISGKQQEVEVETNVEAEAEPAGLLQVIRERFPANLNNSLNTILFLSRAPDDGLEVRRIENND